MCLLEYVLSLFNEEKFLKTILNQIDLKFLICQLQVATRKISFKHSRRIFYYEKIATLQSQQRGIATFGLAHQDADARK